MAVIATEATARRGPGRPRRGEMPNTRERLLEAALKLFAAQGFEGTSLREIATETGVQSSAIYAHFASKQDIFDYLMDSAGLLDLQLLGFETDALASANPAEVLPELVMKIMAAFDQPRARMFSSVMMREGLARGQSLAESIARVQAQLHEPFRAWACSGQIRTDFDAEQLVWELLAPLANARFVYLHSSATQAERRLGMEIARQHARFFVTCCVISTDDDRPRDSGRTES
jgi:AcrR family transcriptional regulator